MASDKYPDDENLFAALLLSMVADHKRKLGCSAETIRLRKALAHRWAEQRGGLKQRRTIDGWRWLLGGHSHRHYFGHLSEFSLPCDDHVTYWSNATTRIWVSQPYPGRLDVEEMTAFAKANGLDYTISPWPGWHYPGSVLFVEWFAKGTCWHE